MWTPTERRGDLIIAGVLFSIGLFCIIGSRAMPSGEFSVPGPGVFPTLLGALLCMVSFALSVRTFLIKAPQRVKIGHPYIWSTIIAMTLLAVFFERIGFVSTISLFVGFLLKILTGFRWIPCIVLGAAAAISAYLFFNLLLGIRLPPARWF